MKDGIVKDKVKVFISSREYRLGDDGVTRHFERYKIMRRAIKEMLEATNIAQVYVRECEDKATTTPIKEDYLTALNQQDICVFIIDNEDDKDEHAQGVVNEYQKARELKKPSAYIFCDEFSKAKTIIAKEVMTSEGNTCVTAHTFDDIPSLIYGSVINDIINIYKRQCNPIPQSSKAGDIIDVTKSIIPSVAIETPNSIKPFEDIGVNSTARKFDFTSFPALKSELDKILGGNNIVNSTNDFDLLCTSLFSIITYKKDFDIKVLEKLDAEILRQNNVEYKDVLAHRIIALKAYLSGDINKCYDNLQLAYSTAKEINGYPNWLLLDILIDLRNVESVVAAEDGRISFGGEWQSFINSNEEMVYYPVLDRYVENHYKEIDKFLREHKIESPYTTRLGNAASPMFESCVKAFAIAVSNVSLTQMLSIRERLIASLSALCQVYTAHNQFLELLRLLCIDAKEKDTEKHILTFGYMQNISAITNLGMKEVLNSTLRIPIKSNRTRAIITLFQNFGYYFSDEDYIMISDEIGGIIDSFLKHDKSVTILFDSITKAILKNMERIDLNKIIEYIIHFTKFNTPYVRESTKLLTYTRFTEIDKDDKEKLLSAYIASATQGLNSEINVILQGLSTLRKLFPEYADRIDDVVKKQSEAYYYSDYALECDLSDKDGKKIDHISRFINSARSRNETQGKNGMFTGYASEPLQVLSNLVIHFHDNVPIAKIADIVSIAKETLFTDTQTYSAKIYAVELLLQICNNYDCSFLDDVKDSIITSSKNILNANNIGLFEKDTKFLLRFNLMLLHIRLGNDSMSDLLSATSMFISDDYTLIRMYKALFEFSHKSDWSNIDERTLFVICQFALKGCGHSNYEVRILSSRTLFELLRTDYSQIISEQLSSMMDNADWQLTIDIIHSIKRANDIDEKLKTFVSQKATSSNHYLVRQAQMS